MSSRSATRRKKKEDERRVAQNSRKPGGRTDCEHCAPRSQVCDHDDRDHAIICDHCEHTIAIETLVEVVEGHTRTRSTNTPSSPQVVVLLQQQQEQNGDDDVYDPPGDLMLTKKDDNDAYGPPGDLMQNNEGGGGERHTHTTSTSTSSSTTNGGATPSPPDTGGDNPQSTNNLNVTGSDDVEAVQKATPSAVITTSLATPASPAAGNSSIFDRLKGKRLADEAKRLASNPGARLQWDKYKIKPIVKSDKSPARNRKGFGIHVAVIPGEGFCLRFDNYKVQKCLNDLIWKNLRDDTMTPSERKVIEDMQNAGFILRAYTWIDNGEVQKSFMNTQIKLFFLLSEDTSAVSKEDMVAFFGSLCDNFINQLPICLDNNIVTSVNQDSFLWKQETGYSELIGTDAAMTRFRYEVQDMTEVPDPCRWFCENRKEVFKYFRPGTWTVEVALLFQPPEYEHLLSPSELQEMRKMEVDMAENSNNMDVSPSITPVAMG